jgi:hypothetical protein
LQPARLRLRTGIQDWLGHEQLEWEPGFAVDYAIASVEQAKLAVLDAVEGRVQAERAKQA